MLGEIYSRCWESDLESQGFFDSLGLWLGSLIRFIVEALTYVLTSFSEAGASFINGLSRALGMEPSWVSLVALVIGLVLLVSSIRSFSQRKWIRGTLWLLVALWLLSLIIH